FLLIAEEGKIEDLTRKLMRIGMDNIYGYIAEVNEMDLDLQTADIIDIDTFKTYVGQHDVQIVDVRSEGEYKTGHIAGADHVFVGTLLQNLDKISKDKQVVIHCQAGDRSTIAYSLLKRIGFDNVKNYSGGMKEWKEKGKPVV
ncbi:MAG: rhodanese-like domain-containing protein, partial [Sphingobacterium sp.]